MAGLIFTDANFQGIGNDGLVVPYGKLYITNVSTGLNATTYQDSDMLIPNTNPVILSSSGKAKVFLSYGKYNINLYDQFNAIVWTLNNFVSSILDNQTIVDAAAATAVYATSAQNSANIATTQASQALASQNAALSYSLTSAAYANMEWAGFSVSDGDLIVSYTSGATSIPSLVNGDFIITY
jgi:hypothetical protein